MATVRKPPTPPGIKHPTAAARETTRWNKHGHQAWNRRMLETSRRLLPDDILRVEELSDHE